MSRSLIDADTALLDAMIERSSIRNASVGITGMLWSDGSSFAQVLEGEHDDISVTMARIATDIRHADLEIVVDREVRSRAFGNRGMIQPDDQSDALAATAFLVGLSLSQNGSAARRLHDIVVACDL